MQFRAFDINECEDLILAHSHRLAGQRIAKGSRLTRTLIDAFIQNGVQQLVCAAPDQGDLSEDCLLYTSPSPRDRSLSRMPSSA